jgi:hypothetical protein
MVREPLIGSLRCPNCGDACVLEFGDHPYVVGEMALEMRDCPVLRCHTCSHVAVADSGRFAIEHLAGRAVERRGTQRVVRCPGWDQRYDFAVAAAFR